MTWEIWRLSPDCTSPDDTTAILEVLDFGTDEGAAQAKFAEMQADAKVVGGAFELRRDGKYVSFFSVNVPEVKG